MRWIWAALVGVGCGTTTDVDGVDTPSPEVPTAQLSSTSPRAWDVPLVCEAPGRIQWFQGGLPYTGELLTTQVEGDTLPASALKPGTAFTCEATSDEGVAVARAVVRRPSVLLVVADDLGYGDVGAFGGSIPTPSLDALADAGTRVEAGYVTAGSCSPSRAGLLTGRQQQRFGFEYNIGANATPASRYQRGLPPQEVTLPEVLGQVMRTGMVGKWHLGSAERFHPNVRGFDWFYGFLGGQRLSMAPGLDGVVEAAVGANEPSSWPKSTSGGFMERNGVREDPAGDRHLSDVFADEALGFIEQSDDPFFLYLAFNAPHIPLQAPPEHLALVEPSDDPLQYAYEATVAGMDAAFGRLLTQLEQLPQGDDTIVVFLSDNGCIDLGEVCSNGIFQGGKLSMMEGGIRVPFLIAWPDRIEAGGVLDEPVSSLDLLPTLAGLVGADLPLGARLDGLNLSGWWRGEREAPALRPLFWRTWPVEGVRLGDEKYVRGGAYRWRFNLVEDPSEQHNLVDDDPARAAQFETLLDARRLLYGTPLWDPQDTEITYYGEWLPIFY